MGGIATSNKNNLHRHRDVGFVFKTFPAFGCLVNCPKWQKGPETACWTFDGSFFLINSCQNGSDSLLDSSVSAAAVPISYSSQLVSPKRNFYLCWFSDNAPFVGLVYARYFWEHINLGEFVWHSAPKDNFVVLVNNNRRRQPTATSFWQWQQPLVLMWICSLAVAPLDVAVVASHLPFITFHLSFEMEWQKFSSVQVYCTKKKKKKTKKKRLASDTVLRFSLGFELFWMHQFACCEEKTFARRRQSVVSFCSHLK